MPELIASPATMRYYQRNIELVKEIVPPDEWEELNPFAGNDSPLAATLWETAIGKTTHHSRSRIKSELYDRQRIDAWMTEHRMSNSNFAFLLGCSSGTVANIRSGHYTGRPMIERVMVVIEGYR